MHSQPQMYEAVLSLGSNQGDRQGWLERACEALAAWPGIRMADRSPIYETEPVDVHPEFAEHLYLNRIVIVETDLEPEAFSTAVHAIEQRLGRQRGRGANLPRTIDIDIITCADRRCDLPHLTLPHPRARQRRFVLQPLADLRPGLVLPGERRTVAELLAELPETPRVSRLV